MISGYARRVCNELGLSEMREISLSMTAEALRALAEHIRQSADEMEQATSYHWHRHSTDALQRMVGCDVIVSMPAPFRR